MDSIKVIKTGKKQKLLIDGNYFIKFRESDDITSWCCDKKGTLKCKSIVKTSLVDDKYEIKDGPTEHDHTDPKNRKLIVATPKKAIIGKSKRLPKKLAPIELDFEEKSTKSDHTDSPKKIIPSATPRKKYTRKLGDIPYTDQPIPADLGVQQIKFIKWREDKPEKLFIDGFYYSIKNKTKKTCSWVCINYKNEIKCHARVITIFTSGAHRLKRAPDLSQHNHDVTQITAGLKPYIDQNDNVSSTDPIPVKKKRIIKEKVISPEKTTVVMDISMHTQLMSHLPQTDIIEFPPPTDYEIEVVILFGLRRQMLPDQIYYEMQSIYGIHAPSFDTVSDFCARFQRGYRPTNVSGSEKWINDKYLEHIKAEIDHDPNVSREFLTVQPDI